MGMDTVELVMKIEETFGIEMPADDTLDLLEDGDVRIGQLYGYIILKTGYREMVRSDFGLNLAFWQRMREVLHEVTGRSTAEIQLATPLADLFPRGTRPDDWKHLREVCPWHVGSLDYSALLRYTGLLAALGLLAFELFQWRELFRDSAWMFVFIVLGILVFTESYAKVLWFLRPLRRTFPAGMCSVKDLCRTVLASNAVTISEEFGGREATISAEVWEKLTRILADISGTDPLAITFETRMFRDLGLA